MAVQFDARNVSAYARADDYRPGDWERPGAVQGDERPEPMPSPSVSAEYRIDEAGQRGRADAAAAGGEVPEGQPTADPAAAGPEAPPADEANPPTAADDLSGLGAAYTQNNRPAQMLWNEHSVNLVTGAGREQNGLSEAQAQQNAELASAVMTVQAPDGAAAGVQELAAADVAMLLRATGIAYERQDPNQLLAATRYINEAPDAGNQQERIRKALDGFHVLGNIGHPQLSSQEMKDLLWGAANVPGHAFGSMNQGEVAAKYQEVVGALNGPAGDYKIRIGKHDLKFTLDEAGAVTDSSTKKPSVWGKILKGVLTVASFIPIPVIAIPARIASAAISTVEGIKNGNWLQAVAGAAGGIAAGAGAIAGKATAGVAATTAGIATNVANAARGAQAVLNAAQTGSVSGIVGAGLQVGAAAAGAFVNGADQVANVARDVQTWANRALVGNKVAVNLGNGNVLGAVSDGAALTALVAGDFKNADGSLKPVAEQVQRYADYAAAGAGIAGNVQQGNHAAALSIGSNLAGRLQAQFGDPDPSRPVQAAADPAKPGQPRPSPNGTVAQYLDYAASAVGIGQNLHRGNYEAALAGAGTLADNIADDPRQVRDGQPGTIGQWLNYGANAVNIGSNLVKRNFEHVLGRSSQFLAQIDRNGTQDGANAATQNADPSLLQRFSEWAGWGAGAHQVVNKVRGGQYEAAVEQGYKLGIGIAADLLRPDEAPAQHDRRWAKIQRVGGELVTAGAGVSGAIRGGDMLAIAQATGRFTDTARAHFGAPPVLPSRPLPGGPVAPTMPALESRSVAGQLALDPIAARPLPSMLAELQPAPVSIPVSELLARVSTGVPAGNPQVSPAALSAPQQGAADLARGAGSEFMSVMQQIRGLSYAVPTVVHYPRPEYNIPLRIGSTADEQAAVARAANQIHAVEARLDQRFGQDADANPEQVQALKNVMWNFLQAKEKVGEKEFDKLYGWYQASCEAAKGLMSAAECEALAEMGQELAQAHQFNTAVNQRYSLQDDRERQQHQMTRFEVYQKLAQSDPGQPFVLAAQGMRNPTPNPELFARVAGLPLSQILAVSNDTGFAGGAVQADREQSIATYGYALRAALDAGRENQLTLMAHSNGTQTMRTALEQLGANIDPAQIYLFAPNAEISHVNDILSRTGGAPVTFVVSPHDPFVQTASRVAGLEELLRTYGSNGRVTVMATVGDGGVTGHLVDNLTWRQAQGMTVAYMKDGKLTDEGRQYLLRQAGYHVR